MTKPDAKDSCKATAVHTQQLYSSPIKTRVHIRQRNGRIINRHIAVAANARKEVDSTYFKALMCRFN